MANEWYSAENKQRSFPHELDRLSILTATNNHGR